MKAAQAEIKATATVNTSDQLGGPKPEDSTEHHAKESAHHENKKKGENLVETAESD